MEIIYKVPNGKLIKMFLEINDHQISNIKITGDFFIYPEEKIVWIEKFLIGQFLGKKNILEEKLQKFIEDAKMDLFGINAKSIIEVVYMGIIT
ncbi:MAG: hypothetical protein UR28_C0033G0010 [Candidatus Peregrinibacteria bacterium GW2011_GWF2_33_10]|nr:MAG: hypothetical protein UR28_C0033G0010 [Candidatus Peregrinibacteria bacterium GW2011_GWF2_33_10]OGJ44344.1 MAG: hypothetical protein A2272_05730 [Candidatus Peregrinibacteria bacterium RIFOXYA12_FULL_33_12]OGJ44472.1 MAG: hypothetical protein A2263_00320 [Candidatus Peregrinibacteria bacterium RIFOXYA2_FULL_33_21]OGJ50222.1 MAG: hypothetical protein A2307_06575 [Candidatus Peregrinibacteria bacterium RIFOXYB2_FULL_33_20]